MAMAVSFSELQEKADHYYQMITECCKMHICIFQFTACSLNICGEKFSIKPHQLPNNFIVNRKIFQKIKKLSLNVSEYKEVFTDERIINMIRSFGNYQLMLLLCNQNHYKELYFNSIGALEKSHLLLEHISESDWDAYASDAYSEMTFVLIEVQHLITKNSKYDMGMCMLSLFIKTFIIQSLVLSTKLFRLKKRCNCYSKRYGDCKMHVAFAWKTKASLGYLMIFAANEIRMALHKQNAETMERCVIEYCINFLDFRDAKLNRNILSELKQRTKDILSWNLHDFRRIGKEHVFSTFQIMMKKGSVRSFLAIRNGHLLHMMGKISLSIDKDYYKAIKYFGGSCCCAIGLYERVLSLEGLSQSCYMTKQYLIGFKVLKYAYKLSNNYILPSFATTRYWIWKQKFKQHIGAMKCGNIKCRFDLELVGRLRACCGCMNIAYCCRRCQKIDWKQKHNYLCDRSWNNMYSLIKYTIFDSV
eukprot:391164_1